MKLPLNGEEEARLVRRREGQGQHFLDSDINRELGSPSRTIESQSIRINRDDGTARSIIVIRGEKTIGKIVRQLIGECRGQVAVKKTEIQHLEEKIQEFEALLENIEESPIENQ